MVPGIPLARECPKCLGVGINAVHRMPPTGWFERWLSCGHEGEHLCCVCAHCRYLFALPTKQQVIDAHISELEARIHKENGRLGDILAKHMPLTGRDE